MLIAPAQADIALALLLLLTACSPAQDDFRQRKRPVTLTVSAASDLRFAFEELGKAFERESGTRVIFNFGSTGQLAQQIERGADVDLLAAANVSFIDALDRKGLILPGTKALYARGFIVMWTREDSPFRLERIEDVLRTGVKLVAIANPDHAPYGIAAREAFQSAGIWEELQPRLVLGENVSQTLQFAQTGNVDVAIVALSLAVAVKQGRRTRIPQETHSPIDQALAVVKSTQHEREARAFAGFINGPAGRPIMRRYGFVLPGEVFH